MKQVILIMFFLASSHLFAQNHKVAKPVGKIHSENSFLGDTLNMLATKFIMIDKDVINNVDHNFDGTWDFFSDGRTYEPETALKKVQFSTLLKLDHSILLLSKMPRGYYAHRESKKLPWKIKKFEAKL